MENSIFGRFCDNAIESMIRFSIYYKSRILSMFRIDFNFYISVGNIINISNWYQFDYTECVLYNCENLKYNFRELK